MTWPRLPIGSLLLFAAGVALVAAAACKPRTESTLPVVAKSPAWKVTDLAGHEVSAASLKGKVVIVDFWATWCGPCLEELPGYVALQKKYAADGLVVVGLSVDEGGLEKVRAFATQNGLNYTVALADDAVVAAFGGFEAIPTTFLIDRDGNIRHRKTGTMAPAEYEKLVRSLL
jgi:thiol-disulfide isomerase/thioredoxin